jgi:hypothetical protein
MVLGLGWVFFGASLILLAAGVTALVNGQPYGVWYGLGMGGLIGTLVLGPILPVVRKRYREAEERRLRDGQLN